MKRKMVATPFAVTIAAALALGAPVAVSAVQPGETVEVKSTISINPYGNAGKVSAANPNCVEGRQVVIKQKGVGKIGSAATNAKGAWQAEPKYKGALPFKVYAEVKPIVQGTAGPIYKCLAATSKTREISGG